MREFSSLARADGDVLRPELSLVIPVFNAAASIDWLIEQLHVDFQGVDFEVVLVNDGSSDSSEESCLRLLRKFPDTVQYIHLARNYGEHTAVLAGLRHTRGRFVAILDDDGQNPPCEARRMYEHAWRHDFDVVYGRYEYRKHSFFRRAGSWFNNLVAGYVLDKPRGIHISSFKVMSRMVVDELVKYDGKFPYLDGMIFRITQNVDEIGVSHLPRRAGRSGYNLRKLVALWMNMFLGFSMVPLRAAIVVGCTLSAIGMLTLAAVIARAWSDPPLGVSLPLLTACIAVFAVGQYIMIGTLGEYMGRSYLQGNGAPQYVVRYVQRAVEAGRPLHDESPHDSPVVPKHTSSWPVY
jgi:undecaprenyl-phosphate 4-deoxy-4-formamido-L-arabinose transferase